MPVTFYLLIYLNAFHALSRTQGENESLHCFRIHVFFRASSCGVDTVFPRFRHMCQNPGSSLFRVDQNRSEAMADKSSPLLAPGAELKHLGAPSSLPRSCVCVCVCSSLPHSRTPPLSLGRRPAGQEEEGRRRKLGPIRVSDSNVAPLEARVRVRILTMRLTSASVSLWM